MFKQHHLAILCALLLSAGAAQADITDNSFVSLLGGWSSHPDLSFGTGHAAVKDGYNVGARIGTWLDPLPGFTLDADYFFNRSDYAGTSAHLNSSSFMGDLVYHIPTKLPFDLYGGAGVGLVNDDLDGSLHGGSTVLGWQALGGIEFPLNEGTSLFGEYRYQNAHDANLGAIHNVGNTSNNLSIGVKFNL
jgi:opacity protein-like surface antigen